MQNSGMIASLIRNDLEIFDYRLFNYGLKPHMLDFVTDEDNHALTRLEILKQIEFCGADLTLYLIL